ncbi:hypothetical protein BS78_05G242400 [Paspalum vaginatum]|nr:hypothetical protein BS78_05G242400 [Paspalum vaginatum]
MPEGGIDQVEPLLRVDRQELIRRTTAADTAGGGGAAASVFRRPTVLLVALGFLLLITFNSTMVIYRSCRQQDGGAVGFVAFSYLDLLLLLGCLRWSERAHPGSATTRDCLKMAVVCLLTLAFACFSCSYKVASAITAVLGGFYAFFSHEDNQGQTTARLLLAAFSGGGHARRRLIADTGASMHAVGDPRLLKGLRFYVDPQQVRLPNGACLNVLGVGSIEWGDTFRIPNVSLVEGFEKSLISIGQLDRDHGMHSYFGKGICEIMQADKITRAGGALLENDGMYVLTFLVVP